jgi:hypothetical protein
MREDVQKRAWEVIADWMTDDDREEGEDNAHRLMSCLADEGIGLVDLRAGGTDYGNLGRMAWHAVNDPVEPPPETTAEAYGLVGLVLAQRLIALGWQPPAPEPEGGE